MTSSEPPPPRPSPLVPGYLLGEPTKPDGGALAEKASASAPASGPHKPTTVAPPRGGGFKPTLTTTPAATTTTPTATKKSDDYGF
jgi:hypothetical protein